jgi:hypothetical protein
MARKKKCNVDYFPHYCQHKSTMFIIEQKYGNNGYAFWFKLLEILGHTDGHVMDAGNPAQWEFLQAKTHLDDATCREILDLLARLDAIDRELWEQDSVIWSDHFVEGIRDAYSKRAGDLPVKPSIRPGLNEKEGNPGQSTSGSTEIKGKERKGNYIPKGTAETVPYEQPTPEEISEASAPKIESLVEQTCSKLYEGKVFPKVHAWRNKQRKEGKNDRAILHTLCRCYLAKPEDPWGYCEKIITLENLNYNERDHQKAT